MTETETRGRMAREEQGEAAAEYGAIAQPPPSLESGHPLTLSPAHSLTPRRALITGITGQDGSYLAEWLLQQGYDVFGVVRRASTESFERIAHLGGRIHLHQAD